MTFEYTIINQSGAKQNGTVDAPTIELAVESLQKRGFIVVSVAPQAVKGGKGLDSFMRFINGRVGLKDIVVMSRQIASLFDAQVSAVKAFNLMADSTKNVALQNVLHGVSEDIQGGITISDAMVKHPDAFSDFYVNMVRAGEESGKLTDTFNYLADYMERQYELTSKTKNALIYPSFVIFTFITVLVLMMTLVIPKLSIVIIESGQEMPIYTQFVIWLSDVLVNYGFVILVGLVLAGAGIGVQMRTERGRMWLDTVKVSIPFLGDLFQKMYLSRISDNLSTMLAAGIPMIRTLEITKSVVGNKVYEKIITDTIEAVRGGQSISDTFRTYPLIPQVLTSMIQIGEETGTLATTLKKLSGYYKREVETAVDTMIGLIEPAMIIALGASVGFLLMSVLVPIYNIANSIN